MLNSGAEALASTSQRWSGLVSVKVPCQTAIAGASPSALVFC